MNTDEPLCAPEQSNLGWEGPESHLQLLWRKNTPRQEQSHEGSRLVPVSMQLKGLAQPDAHMEPNCANQKSPGPGLCRLPAPGQGPAILKGGGPS